MSAHRDTYLTASAEEIERVRVRTVGVLLDGLHDLLGYLTTRNSCHEACNAVLFGTLYREMSARGILSPRPAPPFDGISIAEVDLMARSMTSPMLYRDFRAYRLPCTCLIQTFLRPIQEQVTSNVHGLELENYVTNPWATTAGSRGIARSSAP